LTISNPSSNTYGGGLNTGQSFINDPSGSGVSILLNDWTFAFWNGSNANTAKTLSLSIYNGIGNGGIKVGESIGASSSTFSFNSVVWNFSGLTLIDTSTYTAVVNGDGTAAFVFSTINPYPNGSLTVDTSIPNTNFDTVFQANFSPTPVPFEFEPTGGFMVLVGGWLFRRHLKNKKATKV
jgi:hypothetical protein